MAYNALQVDYRIALRWHDLFSVGPNCAWLNVIFFVFIMMSCITLSIVQLCEGPQEILLSEERTTQDKTKDR